MPRLDKIIREPGQQQIQKIIKAKKPDANAEQVPVERRETDSCPWNLRRTRVLAPGGNQKPGDQPNQRTESQNHEHRSPAKGRNQPRNDYATHREPQSRSGIENAAGEPPTFGGEEQVYHLRTAWKINRLANAEEDPQAQESGHTAHKARKPASQRPDREHRSVQPTDREAIQTQAHWNLHQGVRPEERRQE